MTAAPIAPLSCALNDVVEEPGQAALLRAVVAGRAGPAAATVFTGRSVTDPATTILVLCTEATDGMDSNGGSLQTSFETVTEDGLTSDLGHRDELMTARVGRVGSDVARVELVLVSGARVRAIIAGGYWLAIWNGSVDAERIVALDNAGKAIDSIEP